MAIARHIAEHAALGVDTRYAPYHYLVHTSGSVVKVKSGETGRTVYSHATPSTAIQWALDNLTADRTTKERVYLRGDFTLSALLRVRSHTILQWDGKLSLAAGVAPGTLNNYGIIQGGDQSAGVTDVDIFGGAIDANGANQAGKKCDAIHFRQAQRIRVQGCKIENAGNEGIELVGCSDFVISHNLIEGSLDDGISILASYWGTVANNVSRNHLDQTGASSGIEIEDGTHYVTISGNVCYGSPVGIRIITDSGSSEDSCHHLTVTGNVCQSSNIDSNGASGITCGTNKTGEFITDVTISGNMVYDTHTYGISLFRARGCTVNGNSIQDAGNIGINLNTCHQCSVAGNSVRQSQGAGVQLISATYNVVSGNAIFDSAQNGTFGYGINCTTGATDNLIVGNLVTDSTGAEQDRGIRINANDNIVIGNQLKGNVGIGLVVSSGTGLVIRDNTSYVTENNGTATVANGTTSIAVTHGLSATPALDDISVTPTNNLGDATKFWISNPTATQFTVNVDADPGAGTATFAWSASIQ